LRATNWYSGRIYVLRGTPQWSDWCSRQGL